MLTWPPADSSCVIAALAWRRGLISFGRSRVFAPDRLSESIRMAWNCTDGAVPHVVSTAKESSAALASRPAA